MNSSLTWTSEAVHFNKLNYVREFTLRCEIYFEIYLCSYLKISVTNQKDQHRLYYIAGKNPSQKKLEEKKWKLEKLLLIHTE